MQTAFMDHWAEREDLIGNSNFLVTRRFSSGGKRHSMQTLAPGVLLDLFQRPVRACMVGGALFQQEKVLHPPYKHGLVFCRK
jgi:hypothetical protein